LENSSFEDIVDDVVYKSHTVTTFNLCKKEWYW